MMNKLSAIILCIVVGLGSLALGFGIGFNAQPERNVPSWVSKLPAEYEIVIETGEVSETYSYSGDNRKISDDAIFLRILSWVGLGGPQAAVQRQGIDVTDKTVNAGSHDYSTVERIVNWIQTAFWSIIFVAIILIVLPFVPYVGPVVRSIYRGIAALIPGLGSIIEKLIGDKKVEQQKAVATDIVKSVQKAKDKSLTDPAVRESFNAELDKAQDSGTKAAVKEIKA